MVDHANQSAQDTVISAVKLARLLTSHILTTNGEFDPYLSLCHLAFSFVQFVDEGSLITAPAPSFGNLRANGTGGTSDLVGQRVALFLWKPFGYLKYCHRSLKCSLINLQVTVVCDFLVHGTILSLLFILYVILSSSHLVILSSC